MKISVIDTARGNRFLWTQRVRDTDEEHTADMLHAPRCAVHEDVTILRNEQPIAACVLRWVGTQGDYACFNGLNDNFVGEYATELRADTFEPGDEIIVTPVGKASRFFERLLWAQFTIVDYWGKSATLYTD